MENKIEILQERKSVTFQLAGTFKRHLSLSYYNLQTADHFDSYS